MTGPPANAPRVARPKALACPNCGGTVDLRGFGLALSAVCVQCLSVIDTQSPTLKILQQFQAAQREIPLIPLGKRGKFDGVEWECIGFQVRRIMVDGQAYQWHEYLLFNPFQGFRYLTQYDGHWNFVRTLRRLPKQRKKAVELDGVTFKHFQESDASTTYVLGEFPWRVKVGEQARVDDYVAPPRMLSSESTEGEVNWSVGDYIPGQEVWRAFQLPGQAPAAIGVYANQPAPARGGAGMWLVALALVGLLVFSMLAARTLMANRTVFEESYVYYPGDKGENSFVTPVFEIVGRSTNVEVELRTNLDNQWTFFNMALINERTGEARDWGRELSYYRGRDSDGSWTEGSARDSSLVPSVPAGRYYLRIEPEWQAAAGRTSAPAVRYSVTVKRDVTVFWPYLVALPLLFIPALVDFWRGRAFEFRRWQESSYAVSTSSDDDSGDDD